MLSQNSSIRRSQGDTKLAFDRLFHFLHTIFFFPIDSGIVLTRVLLPSTGLHMHKLNCYMAAVTASDWTLII